MKKINKYSSSSCSRWPGFLVQMDPLPNYYNSDDWPTAAVYDVDKDLHCRVLMAQRNRHSMRSCFGCAELRHQPMTMTKTSRFLPMTWLTGRKLRHGWSLRWRQWRHHQRWCVAIVRFWWAENAVHFNSLPQIECVTSRIKWRNGRRVQRIK